MSICGGVAIVFGRCAAESRPFLTFSALTLPKPTAYDQSMSRNNPDNLPPGPAPSLRRGLYGRMQKSPLEFFMEVVRDFGDVAGLRLLKFRTIFINHPDMIEDVLVKNAKKFHKGRVLKANKRLFGEGLLTSEGDFWLRQRRLAQPAFHRTRIAAYGETMVQYAERAMSEWRNGEARDIHAEMMQLTLQIVGKTLFDADVAGDAQKVGRTLDLLMKLGANFGRSILVPLWLPTPRNVRATLGIRRLEKIIYRIISERRAGGSDTGDLLSMLLAAQDDDGSRMSDRQLRDESITIFLAGHETTANLLSWTWRLLALYPAVEKKLHEELAGLLGGRPPGLEDLPKLEYMNHLLTESLRLYPPAWGMARLTIEEHEIAGYSLHPGNGVAFAQWVVHRDARWYDAPEEFRPERWADGLAKRIPRFAYFPFGGGPRQCIGNTFALMEASLILATIAQRFQFRLVPGHQVIPLASITLRPRNGIRVTIQSRK
jgi:cytochrome P450